MTQLMLATSTLKKMIVRLHFLLITKDLPKLKTPSSQLFLILSCCPLSLPILLALTRSLLFSFRLSYGQHSGVCPLSKSTFQNSNKSSYFKPLLNTVQLERSKSLIQVHFETDNLRNQLDYVFKIGSRCAHVDTVVASCPFFGQLGKRIIINFLNHAISLTNDCCIRL